MFFNLFPNYLKLSNDPLDLKNNVLVEMKITKTNILLLMIRRETDPLGIINIPYMYD